MVQNLRGKTLFITVVLPVVLEVNQRVLADREMLLQLRDKIAIDPLDMRAIGCASVPQARLIPC